MKKDDPLQRHVKIFHIVAVASNGVIGKNNKIPWHFPADLKIFKRLTFGHPVIMGRKTWESLEDRPLPGRLNIVISSSLPPVTLQDVVVATSLEEAIGYVESLPTDNKWKKDIFVIGGEQIYRRSMNLIDGIFLTKVLLRPDGDTMYPEIPEFFHLVSETTSGDNIISFLFYQRTRA
jgi:dihydrofolate reductase